MDCASSGGETALTESVSQTSENGETPATAEGNPTSQENDLTELKEPKLSTDQFYPSLDPTFTTNDEKEKIENINSNELPAPPLSPATDVTEAQKEISSSDGEAKSVHFEAERQSEPIKESKETTDRPNSLESLSGPNTPRDGQGVGTIKYPLRDRLVIGRIRKFTAQQIVNMVCISSKYMYVLIVKRGDRTMEFPQFPLTLNRIQF